MNSPLAPTSGQFRLYVKFAAIVVASITFSLCFACATPLVAFGTFAALTLPRKQALLLVGATWLANQLVGYGLLDYPMTAYSFEWGTILGVCALGATFAAKLVSAHLNENSLSFYWMPLAVAFMVYQLIMLAAALAIGGMEGMAPQIILWAAIVDISAFAGLVGANRLLATVSPTLSLQVSKTA